MKRQNYLSKVASSNWFFQIFMVTIVAIILFHNLGKVNMAQANAPTISIAGLEQAIHQLTNQERQKQGLTALSFDSKLATIARKHSDDMGKRNFFSHVNPDQQTPTQRGALVGYKCRKDYANHYTEGIAENIFKSHLYRSVTYLNGVPSSYDWMSQSDLAKLTVDSWMSSPGHRKNILTKTYDREGIGISIDQATKEVYVTQNFC